MSEINLDDALCLYGEYAENLLTNQSLREILQLAFTNKGVSKAQDWLEELVRRGAISSEDYRYCFDSLEELAGYVEDIQDVAAEVAEREAYYRSHIDVDEYDTDDMYL